MESGVHPPESRLVQENGAPVVRKLDLRIAEVSPIIAKTGMELQRRGTRSLEARAAIPSVRIAGKAVYKCARARGYDHDANSDSGTKTTIPYTCGGSEATIISRSATTSPD